jgi:hypothetical protein
MFTLVSHSHYQNEDMYCPTCGWQGHGYQLKESEEIEPLHIREVYCPHCNRYMGQYSTTSNRQAEEIPTAPLPTIDWFDTF